jgi:hypothetical protein
MEQPAKIATPFTGLFTKKDVLTTTAISFAYLLLSKVLIGYRSDQLFLVILFNVMYYLSFPTRKFIIGFSVYIAYWIVFDYMKAFPNYLYNSVHIESLYNAEKYLFGIHYNNQLLTPNEFWLQNTSNFLDVLCGIFYLCWVPVPLIFSGFMFYKNREQFMQFALTFFFVNILGFIIYYIYPAAAPWYVQVHGFQFNPATPGNTAGLQRFDDFFHVNIFESLYSKSSNVFAAMPSLHSSYPLIVLYYGIKNKLGWINVLFAIVMAGIWFAAVYTSHHYVLDVIAGIITGIVGIYIFQKWLVPNKTFYSIFIKKLIRY